MAPKKKGVWKKKPPDDPFAFGVGDVAPPLSTALKVREKDVYGRDELEPVPHAKRIRLDPGDDTHPPALIHEVVVERVDLPRKSWSLQYDDDGFVCFYAEAEGEDTLLFCEDLFLRQLCSTPSGDLYVQDNTGDRCSTWSLDVKLTDYTKLQATTVHGAMGLHHVHTVYKLSWHRQGFRFFWSIGDL